jgi:pyruvate dehydrogenase E2 component (dihydrolipoamide acetyltransferase)
VADAGNLLAFRAQCNARPGADTRITVTDLLVRACATALAAHPEVNASWDETRILRHRRVSIGVAVALDDGLIVPVIRDADRKTLTEIAREARDLAARARARKLTPDELAGGTFTISNLGMYGIRQFTAVINPPAGSDPRRRRGRPPARRARRPAHDRHHHDPDAVHRPPGRRRRTAAGFLTSLRELIEQPLAIVL